MNTKLHIGKYETSPKKLLLLCLHLLIVIAFTVQILYCIVTFSIIANDGSGTAGLKAKEIPQEEMVTRRLYAIELWISASGLAVYLGVVYGRNMTHFFTKEEQIAKPQIEDQLIEE